MFSNTVDLLAFAEAILKNELLPASKTREWMKPNTHTSSLGLSVGAPWEILRSDNLTSDGRLIDVYTKSGDLGLYHALVGVVPEYDISIAVLTGGAEVSSGGGYARSKIFSSVIQTLLPAIESAGRAESTRFEGTYTDESTNSSLTLTSDKGPGLVIESFQVRGFDVMSYIDTYSLDTAETGLPSPGKLPSVEGRLYPTNRNGKVGNDNATTETAWRAYFDSTTEEDKKKMDSEFFWIDGNCQTWFGMDRSSYNYLSLSEFGFVENAEGEMKAVKNQAFNVTLTKVSGSNPDESDEDQDNGPNSTAPTPFPTGAAVRLTGITGIGALVGTLLMVINVL